MGHGPMPHKGPNFGPIMKKASNRSECFLILLFSCWFLILPAYHNLLILDDSDMTPYYPALGNIDQENPITGSGEKGKIVDSALFVEQLHETCLSLSRIPHPLNKLPVLDSASLILRC